MAQTPEAKVKSFVDKFMKDNFPDAWRYCPPGGPFGNAGAPDRLFLWRGIFIAIEAKAEGNKPTDLQMKHLKLISENNGIAAVVTGKDLQKMELIREHVYRKLQLASEKSGS